MVFLTSIIAQLKFSRTKLRRLTGKKIMSVSQSRFPMLLGALVWFEGVVRKHCSESKGSADRLCTMLPEYHTLLRKQLSLEKRLRKARVSDFSHSGIHANLRKAARLLPPESLTGPR